MIAATWALIGILGAFSLGLLVLHATLHARIGAVSDEMNGRFDAVNGRFDAVNGRFDAVTRRIDEAVARLTGEIRAQGDRLAAHEERHHSP